MTLKSEAQAARDSEAAAETAIAMTASEAVLTPTPTHCSLPRRFADFATLTDAIDYAAQGRRGANFYNARGQLLAVLPYSQLRLEALELARRMVSYGVKPGERVALIAETSPGFLISFCAAVYAGALPTPLPLPTTFGGRDGYIDQVRTQLQSCDPVLALSPPELVDLVRQAAEPIDGCLAGSWNALAAVPPATGVLPEAQPDDIAYLQYSSGSTRFPHGIMVTHRSIMANCHGQGAFGVGLEPDDRGINWLPLYHDMGLVGNVLTPLTCQVSMDYLPTDEFVRRPLIWLDLISRNPHKSISFSPAFGYDITARRAGPDVLARLDLSRWKVAGSGGDMIRPDIMNRFVETFGKVGFDAGAFVACYGLAETTLAVTFVPRGTGVRTDAIEASKLAGLNASGSATLGTRDFVDCGVVIPGHRIAILGADGAALADGEVGKVCVHGPSVMAGYFRDPELTAAVLSPDGWLDTGDMGYRRGDSLFIVGRIKDMIIINGRNLYPQDIEWAAEQASGLKHGDIAAFGVGDGQGDDRIMILVQCRIGDAAARAQLVDAIKDGVQRHTGLLAQVELVGPRALPRTSSGKLARSKARTQFLSGEMSALDAAAA